MAMRTQAPKRYRDADITAMQRYRFNPYKEALLNPISGPLVGVPTSVPIDTYRVRIKTTGTIQISAGGQAVILVNPVHSLCNNALASASGTNQTVGYGAINFKSGQSFGTVDGDSYFLSNAQYASTSFAGLTNTSSVRGRVVSACLRVCNVSSTNDRNGVFTLFKDPQHATLQGKTSSIVAKDPRARQYNASTTDWHNILYHPVEPEEVDGWVWDPRIGPQAGVKTGGYTFNNANDGTAADSYPGYMGIWYVGDTNKAQTLQVELYVIAEYVGDLVQPLVTENEAVVADLQDAHHSVENHTTFNTPAHDGANHTGHAESSTHPSLAQRTLTFGTQHARAIKNVAKMGAVGAAGLAGGAGAARAAAELLFSPGTINQANTYYTGARRVLSAANTPRPRMGYETGGNRRIGY